MIHVSDVGALEHEHWVFGITELEVFLDGCLIVADCHFDGCWLAWWLYSHLA